MVYDERCGRDFRSRSRYNQHAAESIKHYFCSDCTDEFDTFQGLKEHWVQSPNHQYCQYCNRHVDDIENHNSRLHDYCQPCDQVFRNDFGLREHYRQSDRHHYCALCDRHFPSASNLDSHLKSSTHQPKNFKCRGCGSGFVSNSALIRHCEEGGCPSGVTRDDINTTVRRLDTNNFLTDPLRMITAGNDNNSPFNWEVITYQATECSWNGFAYACFLCPRTFTQLSALNQHLASLKHQKKIYICRGPECGKRFAALSGYWQHWESNKCGIRNNQLLEEKMESFLGRMRNLTL